MSPIVTACAHPVSSASEFFPFFSPAAPISEYLHLEQVPVSPLDGVNAGIAQTFPRGVQLLDCLILLHCTPIEGRSDWYWRKQHQTTLVPHA